jgi:hypothetical protein
VNAVVWMQRMLHHQANEHLDEFDMYGGLSIFRLHQS